MQLAGAAALRSVCQPPRPFSPSPAAGSPPDGSGPCRARPGRAGPCLSRACSDLKRGLPAAGAAAGSRGPALGCSPPGCAAGVMRFHITLKSTALGDSPSASHPSFTFCYPPIKVVKEHVIIRYTHPQNHSAVIQAPFCSSSL